jgi:sRNA-binding carbon storage regulator CsrA
MLVLSRKIGKKITIEVGADIRPGDKLEIALLDIDAESQRKNNWKGKLGFDGPQSFKIMRNELLEQPQKGEGQKNDGSGTPTGGTTQAVGSGG